MRIFQGVYIDEFINISEDTVFLLTHWHSDHLNGLSNSFDGTVWCDKITSRLLNNSFPNVKVKVVQTNRFIPEITHQILVLDANHLPGSIMFYFPTQSVLYTGDYRLNSNMLVYLKKRINDVKTIYVDGTYHHPDVSFLSEGDSISLMYDFIDKVKGNIAIGVFHIGTCTLLSKMGINFKIDSSVPERLNMILRVMFGNFVVDDSRFLIVHPHKFNDSSYNLIIPSSLWFSCEGNMKYAKGIVADFKGQWRINYTCHSDYWDNILLKDVLGAKNIFLINKSRVNLKCF